MRIRKLWLRQFRNIRELEYEAAPGLNFLFGDNGQGKTSILEGLGYLGSLRSFRGSKTPEVISWGSEAAEIRALVAPEAAPDLETELKLCFSGHSKTAFINGKGYRSTTSYLSQRFGQYELGIHAIVFNPSDHDLVRGEPSDRRAYLDHAVAAEGLEYLKLHTRYRELLEQRHALLKSPVPAPRDVLLGFTEPWVEAGARLTLFRLSWIQRLQNLLPEIARQIAPAQPTLRLIYHSNWAPEIAGLSIKNKDLDVVHFTGQSPLPSLQDLETAFWKQLSVLETAEQRQGVSLVGPHRDDWGFRIGDHPLKGHGSQGEVRTALLSLKLSELQLFREATGHRPLFLLDDFSSELDRERRLFLLRFLSETDLQVFVTSTESLAGTDALGPKLRIHEGAWVSGDITSKRL